jgi:hypothetical protein
MAVSHRRAVVEWFVAWTSLEPTRRPPCLPAYLPLEIAMSDEPILIRTVHEGVCTLTLNRPRR